MRLQGSAILLLWCLSTATGAVPIDHGNFVGDAVTFEGVVASGFGTPGVRADRLEFFPSVFGVSGSGGEGASDVATLSLALNAASGSRIRSIGFAERGTYNLQGSGTAATLARVSGSVSGEIIALESGTLDSPIPFSGSLLFSSAASPDGNFNLVDDLGLAVVWSGALEIDVDSLVQAAGLTAGATVVNVNLDNLFTIQSETGSFSLIAKNKFEIEVNTAQEAGPGVIPEPSSWLLMAVGILTVVTVALISARLPAK